MMKSLLVLAVSCLLVIPSRADGTTNAAAPAAPAPPSPDTAPAPGVIKIPNDWGLGSQGEPEDFASYQNRIGELHAPGGEAYILPVCLPTLPSGQQFKSVHLRLQLTGIARESGPNTLGNADLYALGVRDTYKVLPADYFQGPGPDPKATLIQANFLTPDSKVRTDPMTGPFIETSSAADTALTEYFNDAYAGGAHAGKYVFLRISYDVDPIPPGNNGYQVLTSGAGGDNEPPVISFTTGPAPKN